MTNEADYEIDDDDNDCFSGIARELEDAGRERGHEFAETLIVLARRLREANGMEDADLDGAAFHHSLAHAIEGFSEGLVDHLSEEIMMDADVISGALIDGALTSGCVDQVSSSQDHIHGSEAEPSVVAEQIQALRELVAEGQALVAVGVDGETLDRDLDGFLAGALEDIHSKAQERGQPVDLVLCEGLILMAVVSTIAGRIRRLPGVGLGLSRILEMDLAATTGDSARSSAEEALDTSLAAITKAMRESAKAPKKVQPKSQKTSSGGAPKSSGPKKAPASKTKRR